MFQRSGPAAYKANLDGTKAVCSMLGNPEKDLKFVHIAGTNGKGTVAHMLSAILQTAGYKVGLYTSPHLKDFRERIKINGQAVDEKSVIDFVNQNLTILEEGGYSFFEVTVGMAFSIFAKAQVDVAIVEVGLGGRLDATNIITPILSVITHISKDHKQFLGDTIAAIASEKAGIIKENIPVVLAKNEKVVQQVIIDKAKSTSSPIFFAEEVSQNEYTTDLSGDYQKENLANVSMAITALSELDVEEKHLIQGLQSVVKNTGFQGRWQILQDSPKVIVDVAHNAAGIAAVIEQIKTMKYNHLHIVFGMVNDKDFGQISAYLPKDANYYFCSPNVLRSKAVDQLFAEASQLGFRGATHDSVASALDAAKQGASISDIILVCGSLFVVTEVL